MFSCKCFEKSAEFSKEFTVVFKFFSLSLNAANSPFNSKVASCLIFKFSSKVEKILSSSCLSASKFCAAFLIIESIGKLSKRNFLTSLDVLNVLAISINSFSAK